jgi:hypothetical protein
MGLNEDDQLVHDRQAGNGFGPHKRPIIGSRWALQDSNL